MKWVSASSYECAYLTTLRSHSSSTVQQVGRDSAHSQTHYSYLLQHWSKHQEAAALLAKEMEGEFCSDALAVAWICSELFVFVVILWEGSVCSFLQDFPFMSITGETTVIQNVQLKFNLSLLFSSPSKNTKRISKLHFYLTFTSSY